MFYYILSQPKFPRWLDHCGFRNGPDLYLTTSATFLWDSTNLFVLLLPSYWGCLKYLMWFCPFGILSWQQERSKDQLFCNYCQYHKRNLRQSRAPLFNSTIFSMLVAICYFQWLLSVYCWVEFFSYFNIKLNSSNAFFSLPPPPYYYSEIDNCILVWFLFHPIVFINFGKTQWHFLFIIFKGLLEIDFVLFCFRVNNVLSIIIFEF